MLNLQLAKKDLSTPAILRSRSVLLFAFVLLAMASGPPLGGQRPAEKGSGFDFFRTAPEGSTFTFSGNLAIPAGFFGQSYERFNGAVAFKGAPIGSFRDVKTGNADTVIARTTPAFGNKYPNEARTEIELVALSLESTKPISVRAGGKTELWDVRVQPSPSKPSKGTMTFVQRNERGGTASSTLTVYPLFTFTRQGDRAERKLDTGTMKLGQDGAKELTLNARDIPWARQQATSTLSDGIVVGSANLPVNHLNDHHRHPVIAISVQ